MFYVLKSLTWLRNVIVKSKELLVLWNAKTLNYLNIRLDYNLHYLSNLIFEEPY